MHHWLIWILLFVAGIAVPGSLSAQEDDAVLPLTPEQTTQLGKLLDRDWEDRPPWADMAISILQGQSMGNGDGWFTGSERRHDWPWLAERYPDAAKDDQITSEEIPELTPEAFARIDQDRDRVLTPGDFRFEKNPLLEDDSPAGSVFTLLDEDSNGRLTMKELQRWFKRSSDGSDFLSIDDLKDALGFGPPPPRPRSEPGPKSNKGQRREDRRWGMLGMLLNGEMGSLNEGPALGADAPELNLPLVARQSEGGGLELTDQFIQLESFRGKKPVVLIFGSFT
jgi:hypothetical protein